jgi:hypothetical protein
MVWVDAICINQESLPERGIQVAKMKSLYERCRGVIVFMGADAVTYSKRFPQLQTLGNLQHGVHPFPPGHTLENPGSASKSFPRANTSVDYGLLKNSWLLSELSSESETLISMQMQRS